MLCQNCKINDSTIHLYTNVNGHQQQVDLCQNCYQIMKTDPNNSLLAGLNQQNRGGRDPFEDFFNSLDQENYKNLYQAYLNKDTSEKKTNNITVNMSFSSSESQVKIEQK